MNGPPEAQVVVTRRPAPPGSPEGQAGEDGIEHSDGDSNDHLHSGA
jgi:hypothetical protein